MVESKFIPKLSNSKIYSFNHYTIDVRELGCISHQRERTCDIGKFPIKRTFWLINSARLLFVFLNGEKETCLRYSKLDRRVEIGWPRAAQGMPSSAVCPRSLRKQCQTWGPGLLEKWKTQLSGRGQEAIHRRSTRGFGEPKSWPSHQTEGDWGSESLRNGLHRTSDWSVTWERNEGFTMLRHWNLRAVGKAVKKLWLI